MEVLLARENGFCFGVKKAVELTEAAAESGRPVHNLGQVVHNPIASVVKHWRGEIDNYIQRQAPVAEVTTKAEEGSEMW